MIKGWKHAGRDLAIARQAASAAEKRYEVRRLNKGGSVSKVPGNPLFDLFVDAALASARVEELERLNPGAKFAVVDRA